MLTLEGVAERIFQQHDICGVERMDMDMYRGGVPSRNHQKKESRARGVLIVITRL